MLRSPLPVVLSLILVAAFISPGRAEQPRYVQCMHQCTQDEFYSRYPECIPYIRHGSPLSKTQADVQMFSRCQGYDKTYEMLCQHRCPAR